MLCFYIQYGHLVGCFHVKAKSVLELFLCDISFFYMNRLLGMEELMSLCCFHMATLGVIMLSTILFRPYDWLYYFLSVVLQSIEGEGFFLAPLVSA